MGRNVNFVINLDQIFIAFDWLLTLGMALYIMSILTMEFVGWFSNAELAWVQALANRYQQNLLCVNNLPQAGMTN